MEIYVLASGSKGNMTYLKVGHIKLFVDAGISYKRIREKNKVWNEAGKKEEEKKRSLEIRK